jgi:GrpB-like predicted nucleotidyltransferase (UPF0157 family)
MLGVPRGKVLLTEYSDGWPGEFALEQRRLARALGGLTVEIAHIGSTAVEGLVAKPIIDIIVGLRDYAQWPQVVALMEPQGYEALGEFGIPGRQFLLRGNPTTHHAHVCVHDGDFWRQTVLFHRVLGQRPDVRNAYAALKRTLAARHSDNREAYTTGKGDFIRSVLAEARRTPGTDA